MLKPLEQGGPVEVWDPNAAVYSVVLVSKSGQRLVSVVGTNDRMVDLVAYSVWRRRWPNEPIIQRVRQMWADKDSYLNRDTAVEVSCDAREFLP